MLENDLGMTFADELFVRKITSFIILFLISLINQIPLTIVFQHSLFTKKEE